MWLFWNLLACAKHLLAMSRKVPTLIVILLTATSLARPIFCESFGNSTLSVPKIGMVFFDTGLKLHKNPWGVTDQWTVGTSYSQAIKYRWWWIADTQVGFGSLSTGDSENIATILGGAGVRFNIFVDDFRPHVGLMLHYLHFLGAAAKKIPLNIDWPIFVGFKPFLGIEWLFYSEMSLAIEGSYGFYLNINEPFRHAFYATVAYSFYF